MVAHSYGARARVSRPARVQALPRLWFFTDPARVADPVAIAARLPQGAGVVYRHFGGSDRAGEAARLAALARERGLVLLIAGDPELARSVGAHGVHWPTERLSAALRSVVRGQDPWLATASVRDPMSLSRALRAGVDGVFIAPVFTTRSASGRAPLGLMRAASLAARAKAGGLAAFGLGGLGARSARCLQALRFDGWAGVDAFADPNAGP